MVQQNPPVRSPASVWQQIVRVCPPEIQTRLQGLAQGVWDQIEELRFRVGQPVQLSGNTFDAFLHKEQGLTQSVNEAFVVNQVQLQRIVQVVTQSSLYAVEDELRRGFVTMAGGHRVGLAGRAVLNDLGGIRSIRSFNGVNLRIAKERLGAADGLRAYASPKGAARPYNMLIISPPQCGKTTLLRDLARQLSEGTMISGQRGLKVGVVDERSEIAGCLDGVPQFRLGPKTDVLDACPKAEGMLMMIRSLSPDVVVTDEIGREQDRDAVLEATHAGVAVLATAHASNLEEWRKRPYMAELFAARAFDRYVLLSRRKGPGTIERVLDSDGIPVGGSEGGVWGMNRT
ncbi:stage III sporulation protein AA [Alicyclobacillus tolerans]|uniref:stage III sporulation protein AA n=1 Tax=Alicyclobacillus tolerans TaxID=90970 RepID=UPI001F003B79|nr:stage III sporulation protein AA [Alicyclobacillus tolerans]MCF8563583.1 stage III sporulation protein AA [Alicyclobacillus tolerans]